jgi:hypothetical protein
MQYPSWNWNEVHKLLNRAKVLEVNYVVVSLYSWTVMGCVLLEYNLLQK